LKIERNLVKTQELSGGKEKPRNASLKTQKKTDTPTSHIDALESGRESEIHVVFGPDSLLTMCPCGG
jgi:hypothetical protein